MPIIDARVERVLISRKYVAKHFPPPKSTPKGCQIKDCLNAAEFDVMKQWRLCNAHVAEYMQQPFPTGSHWLARNTDKG